MQIELTDTAGRYNDPSSTYTEYASVLPSSGSVVVGTSVGNFFAPNLALNVNAGNTAY